MYFDSKRNRILLRDGRSIVSSFDYAKRIIEGESIDGLQCMPDRHTELYEFMNGVQISSQVEDVFPTPVTEDSITLDQVMDVVLSSSRYTATDDEDTRIEMEMRYFIEHDHLSFLYKCYELIQRFKSDNVVWGVGRGSACASYVLFLLEVHDVNPMKYGISFKEMAKEDYED